MSGERFDGRDKPAELVGSELMPITLVSLENIGALAQELTSQNETIEEIRVRTFVADDDSSIVVRHSTLTTPAETSAKHEVTYYDNKNSSLHTFEVRGDEVIRLSLIEFSEQERAKFTPETRAIIDSYDKSNFAEYDSGASRLSENQLCGLIYTLVNASHTVARQQPLEMPSLAGLVNTDSSAPPASHHRLKEFKDIIRGFNINYDVSTITREAKEKFKFTNDFGAADILTVYYGLKSLNGKTRRTIKINCMPEFNDTSIERSRAKPLWEFSHDMGQCVYQDYKMAGQLAQQRPNGYSNHFRPGALSVTEYQAKQIIGLLESLKSDY